MTCKRFISYLLLLNILNGTAKINGSPRNKDNGEIPYKFINDFALGLVATEFAV